MAVKTAVPPRPFDGTVYSVTVKDGVPCLYAMTKTGSAKLFTVRNGEPVEIPEDLTSVFPEAVYRRGNALIAVDAAGAEEIGGGVLLDKWEQELTAFARRYLNRAVASRRLTTRRRARAGGAIPV